MKLLLPDAMLPRAVQPPRTAYHFTEMVEIYSKWRWPSGLVNGVNFRFKGAAVTGGVFPHGAKLNFTVRTRGMMIGERETSGNIVSAIGLPLAFLADGYPGLHCFEPALEFKAEDHFDIEVVGYVPPQPFYVVLSGDFV